MLLNISDLEPGGSWLDQEVQVPDFVWQGGDTVTCGTAQFSGRLARTRRGVELKARFSLVVGISCGRCDRRLALPVERSFRIFLVPGGESGEAFEAMDEDDPDAVDLYPLEGTTVELGEVIREQIDLALPYRVVCEDAGLGCEIEPEKWGGEAGEAEPGEAAVDERWGELLKFKKGLQGSSPDDDSGSRT